MGAAFPLSHQSSLAVFSPLAGGGHRCAALQGRGPVVPWGWAGPANITPPHPLLCCQKSITSNAVPEALWWKKNFKTKQNKKINSLTDPGQSAEEQGQREEFKHKGATVKNLHFCTKQSSRWTQKEALLWKRPNINKYQHPTPGKLSQTSTGKE